MNRLTLIFLAFVYIAIEIPSIAYRALVSVFTSTQKGVDTADRAMLIAIKASPLGVIFEVHKQIAKSIS